MTEDRSELSLAFARVLFVNGQATDQIVASIRRLTGKLGLKAELPPRWGELQLSSKNDGSSQITSVEADPVGVDMDRVVSTMQTVADIEAGRLSAEQTSKRIEAVAKAPPAPAGKTAMVTGGYSGIGVETVRAFLMPSTNPRSDRYGGPIVQRMNFVMELVEALTQAFGRDRVGIRLSPFPHGLRAAKSMTKC